MKKIIGLSIVAVLLITIAGLGTFAFFSDTETSTDNVFSAGTLDLGLSDTAGSNSVSGMATAVFSNSNWVPGGANVSDTLYINNKGSIPMSTLTVSFDYTITGTVPASVDAGNDDIDEMVTVVSATFDGNDIDVMEDKTLAELKAHGAWELPSGLGANDDAPLAMTFAFGDADNGCQNQTVTMTISVYGQQ